jgi:hypothetical protein
MIHTFMILVIKHAEQIAVNQQEIYISPKANNRMGIMSVLHDCYCLYEFKDRMECQFRETLLLNKGLKF